MTNPCAVLVKKRATTNDVLSNLMKNAGADSDKTVTARSKVCLGRLNLVNLLERRAAPAREKEKAPTILPDVTLLCPQTW